MLVPQSNVCKLIDNFGYKNIEPNRPPQSSSQEMIALSNNMEIDSIKRAPKRKKTHEQEYGLSAQLTSIILLLHDIDPVGSLYNEDYALIAEDLASATSHSEIPIPSSYNEALRHPVYGKMWRA
ncbi:hypothetical protein K3495_g9624 [Podosphaera aphanis]|nr:hypothetical protein K3495_g9624 [Podosphaera aphanis]